LAVSGNITTYVERGDTIAVGSEIMLVSAGGSYSVASGLTTVPLSRPYLGANLTSVEIHRLKNCTTGKYLVTYHPVIRGYYQINLMTNSVDEVQYVEFLSEGGLGGNYTLTVVSESAGQTVSATTAWLLGLLREQYRRCP
jgi:hypothetical protein